MKHLFLLIILTLAPLAGRAQFTIVDADSHEAIPGVYVFAQNGTLLGLSNENGVVTGAKGRVTLSMLSYEPLTVDATGLTGEVTLKAQPYVLGEAKVGRPDFIKISGTFRDVVTNSGKLVMYREGIVDFYYNTAAKSWTRRIRGCRQYEHPKLGKASYIDSLYSGINKVINLGKIHEVESTGAEQRGDTLLVALKKGKTSVTDAAMVYKLNGLYHSVIDALKVRKPMSINIFGSTLKETACISHWTYSDDTGAMASLVALRSYRVEENRSTKKAPVVAAEKTMDFVVNDVAYLSKETAKEEMKDNTTSKDFRLPQCLPAIPEALTEQIPLLSPTRLHKGDLW